MGNRPGPAPTETVITRLDALVHGCSETTVYVAISPQDAKALLDIVHEGCEDTMRCAHCAAVWCATCGVGDGSDDCDPPHCMACAERCTDCGVEYAREHAEAARADVALERCEQA